MDRSGLSDEELREFAQEVILVMCRGWPTADRRLESATIRERLEERGVEVPDWAMYDVFEHFGGGLINYFLGGPQNPDDPADVEGVRRHGGITITGVDPDICG